MNAEFAQLLAEGNLDAVLAAWAKLFPGAALPDRRDHAEIVLHHARTQARSVPMRARAWSHRWLLERGLPSGLPDHLRPRAERLYPVTREGVGISVIAGSSLFRPIVGAVRSAMEGAVLEVYADHKNPDPNVVRARIREARGREVKRLLGI